MTASRASRVSRSPSALTGREQVALGIHGERRALVEIRGDRLARKQRVLRGAVLCARLAQQPLHERVLPEVVYGQLLLPALQPLDGGAEHRERAYVQVARGLGVVLLKALQPEIVAVLEIAQKRVRRGVQRAAAA